MDIEGKRPEDIFAKALCMMPGADLYGLELTKTSHFFGPKIYMRHLWVPKGVLIVGRLHRYDNLNMLVYGSLNVYLEGSVSRITAPCTFLSKAGTRKIGYAIEDFLFSTIHENPSDERDIDAVEDMIFTPEDFKVDQVNKINKEIGSREIKGVQIL